LLARARGPLVAPVWAAARGAAEQVYKIRLYYGW
jgi:hypothetical protein